MIQVAKALDGTFSYVARDPKGDIILLGDQCENVDVVRDFFADLIAAAIDKPAVRQDVHIEVVDEIIDPTQSIKVPISGLGDLVSAMAKGTDPGAEQLVEKVVPEAEFAPGEKQTVAKAVKSTKSKGKKAK
jgi:hypothetical protein